MKYGKDHGNFKGSENINKGRARINIKTNSCKTKRISKTRFICEQILGLKLSWPIVIHHIDGDTLNDNPSNLIVCENQSYHQLIEYRTKAYRASGNANFKKCCFCKKWDDPHKLTHLKSGAYHHKSCANLYYKKRRMLLCLAA